MRAVSLWRKGASKDGDHERTATARGVGGGDGSAVDEEGWFNPLVYDGGARLRPRLKNLQGEELPRMPPLRVQERKWERRFVTSASSTAATPSEDATAGGGNGSGEVTQQQYHELRHFTLTGFMPTHRPPGMMLPAGVRELCGQSYVELEVAPATAEDGTPIAWSAAQWPEPAYTHRRRLEPWMRKWGNRWSGTGPVVVRGAGPGGGEAALALCFEVQDTNNISTMMMHRMIKDGFSQMLRVAPEMQFKVTRELVERRDVNLPLAKDFLKMFCKRTLEGQVLPWLATRQGVAGYMLSRAGTPDEREAMARAAVRWVIRRITQSEEGADEEDADGLAAAVATAGGLGMAAVSAESASGGAHSSSFILDDSRVVSLQRKRPEFLGVRISHRQRKEPPHLQHLRSPRSPRAGGGGVDGRYPQPPSASPSARRV